MFLNFVAALLFVSIIIPLLFYLGIFSLSLINSLFFITKDHKQTIKKIIKVLTIVLILFVIFIYSALLPKGDVKEVLGWILLLPIILFVYSTIQSNLKLTKINKQKRLESKITSISL